MAKEPLVRPNYESICRCYLGHNCIICVTFLLHSRVDTREANVSATIKPPEEERTRCDVAHSMVARPFPFVSAKLLHRHKASLCGSPNRNKRRDEEMGKCFRVVPFARSHCYLIRTTR